MNDLQQCLVINFRTSCADDSQDKKDRLKEQKFEFYCFKKKSNLQIPQRKAENMARGTRIFASFCTFQFTDFLSPKHWILSGLRNIDCVNHPNQTTIWFPLERFATSPSTVMINMYFIANNATINKIIKIKRDTLTFGTRFFHLS